MDRLLSRAVDGVLRMSAQRVPDRIAVRYADRAWTYAELDAAVSTAAAVLREPHHLGLPESARVATYGHNSDAYLVAFLACSRAGLIHVPVNHHLAGEDLAYLLEQSETSWSSPTPPSRSAYPTDSRSRRCGTRPVHSSTRSPHPSRTTATGTPGTSSNCSTPRAPPPCPRAR